MNNSFTASPHPFEGIIEGQLETGSTLQALYLKDPHAEKTNLLPWHHDYLPFLGASGLLKAGEELFFGRQCPLTKLQRVASMQTVGATGAIHMGGRFLQMHYPPWLGQNNSTIYMPKETWVNHRSLVKTLGIQPHDLPYYNASVKSLDWERYKSAVESLPRQSVILVQTGAHNPTGSDPTRDQWVQLIQIFVARGHFAFLDCAYLGLASGDAEADASVIRMFVTATVPLLLAATFGKSFGLYGERVGMLSVIAPNTEVRGKIQKQMVLMARSETGSCPSFGAKVVETVLGDDLIKNQWSEDVNGVAASLQNRRQILRHSLERLRTPGDWNFITQQVGMFSHLDFTPSQVQYLREEHHLYLDQNSRISFAAIDERGIQRVAHGIHDMMQKHVA
ncbi:hypothetical protein RJ55_04034 [Drechmeria coniospora]|nr:hypothetical protein RJ55_04034 [Drechmeria coniospora]